MPVQTSSPCGIIAGNETEEEASLTTKPPTTPTQAQAQYVRPPYRREVLDRVTPIIEHSKAREVAGYVTKRTDQTVKALPPPQRQKAVVEKNKGGQDADPDPQKPGKDRDQGDGDKGNEDDDGDDDDNTPLRAAEAEESDEEYDSASEEPWPEDIWNEEVETRTQKETLRELKRQNVERWTLQEKLRESNQLDGPGLVKIGSYQLFSDSQDVYRLFVHDDFFLSETKVREASLQEAGWAWDEDIKRWYRMAMIGQFETKLFMDVLPESKMSSDLWEVPILDLKIYGRQKPSVV